MDIFRDYNEFLSHTLSQMVKQTIGIPLQYFPYRMDGKLYRLQVHRGEGLTDM